MGRPPTDKRKRLIAAAIDQYHHKGVERASLVQVANAAGVPPGNSYYYFRTKDELTRSVVDEWAIRLIDYLARLEVQPDAWERLTAYLDAALERRSGYTAYGCPLAGLSQDLRRGTEKAAGDGSRLFTLQLEWLRDQFHAAGLSDAESETCARFFLSTIQGSLLLAHATGDAEYIDSTMHKLKGWLAALPDSPQSSLADLKTVGWPK